MGTQEEHNDTKFNSVYGTFKFHCGVIYECVKNLIKTPYYNYIVQGLIFSQKQMEPILTNNDTI